MPSTNRSVLGVSRSKGLGREVLDHFARLFNYTDLDFDIALRFVLCFCVSPLSWQSLMSITSLSCPYVCGAVPVRVCDVWRGGHDNADGSSPISGYRARPRRSTAS
jgi:hypothetical protein